MNGTISITLPEAPPEIDTFTESLNIGRFEWQVQWAKNGASHNFQINCNKNKQKHLWLCRATYTFEVRQADGIWHMLPTMGPDYWYNKYDQAQTTLPAGDDGVEVNPTAVRVHIHIIYPDRDSVDQGLSAINAVLCVKYGNKSDQFHVNRHLLAGNSQFFHNFFFGPTAQKPKNANVFVIVERANLTAVDMHAFGRMLYIVPLSAPQLEQKQFLGQVYNAELLILLEFTVKYEFTNLTPIVEQCLIDRDSATMEQLAVADKSPQELSKLRKHCLKKLDALEYCKNLAKSFHLRAGLNDVTRQCLDQRIGESAEEHQQNIANFEDGAPVVELDQ